MHARTSMSDAIPTSLRRNRCKLALTALVAAALMAGCASRTSRAPITDLSAGGGVAAQSGESLYTVRPGDTLYKIAQAHNMDVNTLAQLNNLSNANVLSVGQQLRLNGSVPAPAAPVAPPAEQGPATPMPVTPVQPVQPTTVARASDAGLISWAWPASGDIIQAFNTNTKGIDIAGTPGDPVYAAADGNVMYAGNGVRGLGNLILLGHSDGFVTAYAHNQTLLVKTGQVIKKGDKIALLGQTDTSSPRLHFEIRRRGTPVNPLSYLPAR
ncbi:LysM peptidoglycan-binding domain-containing protein [Allopusillimonas soli]|uniref:Peptidoglycan DD-metalloendopeptidase family protein n=2 Tax=Allopusillimonas soli TaxID=659016 RepID=A0A853FCM3_9BURK|nr:peptidoglycan DD-metalloendopeptidase family protein [Allopusillimonas soli]TEA75098.1 LysM peptidoglycan-binding domain-containing protein [Allopusillimonas soli]